MRRKLWLLLILSLFLVGRESCCASQEKLFEYIQALHEEQQSGVGKSVLNTILAECLTSLGYWYFDLHQKKKGWYTCKFYYAAGYRTKLFYNRIYLDFYYSLPSFFLLFIMMNINVRIYRDFYIVLKIHLGFLFFFGYMIYKILSTKNRTHSCL